MTNPESDDKKKESRDVGVAGDQVAEPRSTEQHNSANGNQVTLESVGANKLPSSVGEKSDPGGSLLGAAIVAGAAWFAFKGLKWLFSKSKKETGESDEDIKKDISRRLPQRNNIGSEPDSAPPSSLDHGSKQPYPPPYNSVSHEPMDRRRSSHEYATSS